MSEGMDSNELENVAGYQIFLVLFNLNSKARISPFDSANIQSPNPGFFVFKSLLPKGINTQPP